MKQLLPLILFAKIEKIELATGETLERVGGNGRCCVQVSVVKKTERSFLNHKSSQSTRHIHSHHSHLTTAQSSQPSRFTTSQSSHPIRSHSLFTHYTTVITSQHSRHTTPHHSHHSRLTTSHHSHPSHHITAITVVSPHYSYHSGLITVVSQSSQSHHITWWRLEWLCVAQCSGEARREKMRQNGTPVTSGSS